MTADIINLNKARKARARAERTTQAAANRARFGRSKAERAKSAADEDRRERELDGTRREPPPAAPPAAPAAADAAHRDADDAEGLDPGTVS